MTTLSVAARAPFAWPTLVSFMAHRAYAGLEEVTASLYRRVIGLESGPAVLRVRPTTRGLGIDLASDRPMILDAPVRSHLRSRVARLFDARRDSPTILSHLSRDPVLRPVLRRFPGLRIPGAWDPFELVIRAILGQQISVAAATTLAARMITAHGEPVALAHAPALARLFPAPAVVAQATLETLGIIRARANAIRGLASALIADPDLFNRLRGLDHAVSELKRLPGIGEWTAQYVAMRALGEADAFPASDLGLLRAYARLSGRSVTPSELLSIAEPWRPYRAYAAMALWLSESI